MNTSLYFHIPFCNSRCGYCDFVTFAGFERLIPEYMAAVNLQVVQVGKGQSVHTIYFGGGTPSLVSADTYSQLFTTIRSHFEVLDQCEISLEANPGTIDSSLLEGYHRSGFNRISYGMQSALENELNLLERSHSTGDIEKAVSSARLAGFENLSLDLIFGLPNQTLADWQYSLRFALQFKPEHLSLYSLIVEEETPLARQIAKGLIPEPDEDVAAEQFEWSCDFLQQAGYVHYEISNWAKVAENMDYRCQHNLQYWRLNPYLGFGVGAVGFLPAGSGCGELPQTMINENTIGKYIQQVKSKKNLPGCSPYMNPVSDIFERETRLFVGFRLLDEGIRLAEYFQRFHSDLYLDFGEKITRLSKNGLIEERNNTTLCLTRKGLLLANQVFREFCSVDD